MKKSILIILLLLCVFIGISAVSANENMSASDNVLEMDNAIEISQTEQSYLDTSSVSGQSQQSGIVSSPKATEGSGNKDTSQIPSKATAKDIKSVYGTPAEYSVKVVDKAGSNVVGKQVKFVIGKKTYKVQTDEEGVAKLKLNYAAGKYTIKYYIDNLLGKNTYTVKNKITMSILKWGNKGDVSKIKLIKKNMPNNKWVKKAVAATKKGNPLLIFEGGKGKKIFITAGVHGNELSSQVAAMKLIARLSKTPIKGTVYIIPFVNIKAISHKVRHTGADYNRVAHKSGTISNKIVKLVVKYKCDAYGDFHTTKPGGAPGQNIVMGSKTPAKKSMSLTNYIAKHAKVHKRIYKYAGQDYPGALADNVNKKGIPGVICEVVLPHNTVTSSSVKISYRMMNSFMKFNSLI
jgi:predicted deacylase